MPDNAVGPRILIRWPTRPRNSNKVHKLFNVFEQIYNNLQIRVGIRKHNPNSNLLEKKKKVIFIYCFLALLRLQKSVNLSNIFKPTSHNCPYIRQKPRKFMNVLCDISFKKKKNLRYEFNSYMDYTDYQLQDGIPAKAMHGQTTLQSFPTDIRTNKAVSTKNKYLSKSEASNSQKQYNVKYESKGKSQNHQRPSSMQ